MLPTVQQLPWVRPRGKASLKKSGLSYSSYKQLSASEGPAKIGPAIPEIERNTLTDRQTDRQTSFFKNDIMIYIPCVYTLQFNYKRLF